MRKRAVPVSRPDLGNDSGSDDGDNREDGLFVASLAKGLKVLECFADSRDGLNLTEIAASTDIGKSAVQRAVATLHSLGYLRKDERGKIYRLSPKILGLSRNYLAGSDLVEAAMPVLRRCNSETDETVNLTELDGHEVVCVARIPGRQVVAININVGSRLPVYATAPGLMILASSDPQEAAHVLEACDIRSYTKQTVTHIPDLQRWLVEIRKDGYVIADQLMFEGEYSVAAPIFGPRKRVVAAINISAPTSRWSFHDLRSKIVPIVTEAARQITTAIAG
ncbi:MULTISPECIES: IclR family transcriptional regulator C-terminal domain-containing protein [unclassified Chelatococcus]|uniref:IclR family transcriptional regulator n=1 Tax=unclassified Chelatococcus TaxID=2638111 RepID=UPI001BCE77AB|nr:IclR family transcriptional regulator C-terminal domain-containing protein [Chelatococcus sp.]MBS7700387.1 helix-turn-helix domain-containing protein [Chelatococcus sp. YT9]MBX3556183.1 helix-turn-helix domain-containing protein [Chelatococcus sp.]